MNNKQVKDMTREELERNFIRADSNEDYLRVLVDDLKKTNAKLIYENRKLQSIKLKYTKQAYDILKRYFDE